MGVLGRWAAGATERRYVDHYKRTIRGSLDTHDPAGSPITPRVAALMHRQAMGYAAHKVLPRTHRTFPQLQAAEQFKHHMQVPCGVWLAEQLGWHPVLLFETLASASQESELRKVDRDAAYEQEGRYLRQLDELVSKGRLPEATKLARQRNAER